MKHKRILLSLLLAISLASCGDKEVSIKEEISTTYKEEYTVPVPSYLDGYTVTFDCQNGDVCFSKTDEHQKVLKPKEPKKVAATFLGWYTSLDAEKPFDFEMQVSENITLYAKWDQDLLELSNIASTKAILANVRINAYSFNTNGSKKQDENNTIGSGVIIGEDEHYYYVITNNHVIYATTSNLDITITDCYSNSHKGTLDYQNKDYDLALLHFSKTRALEILRPKQTIAKACDFVLSMGETEGISNTVTNGRITDFMYYRSKESDQDKSNISFSCYKHTAPIHHGSSGGALLDSNLNLIGINFSSSYIGSDFQYSLAIPSTRVLEFLSLTSIPIK